MIFCEMETYFIIFTDIAKKNQGFLLKVLFINYWHFIDCNQHILTKLLSDSKR